MQLAEFSLITADDSTPSLHTDREYQEAAEIDFALDHGLCACYCYVKDCKKTAKLIKAGNVAERKLALQR